jgi:hypothetical protein
MGPTTLCSDYPNHIIFTGSQHTSESELQDRAWNHTDILLGITYLHVFATRQVWETQAQTSKSHDFDHFPPSHPSPLCGRSTPGQGLQALTSAGNIPSVLLKEVQNSCSVCQSSFSLPFEEKPSYYMFVASGDTNWDTCGTSGIYL